MRTYTKPTFMDRVKMAAIWIAALGIAMWLISCEENSISARIAQVASTPGSGVTDIHGIDHETIIIGDQEWMTENLNVTTYNDSSEIMTVDGLDEWFGLDTAAFTIYNNSIQSREKYGLLYNWHAVNSEKLCPIGWHVPSDEEWNLLIEVSGGVELAGGVLKYDSTAYWKSPNIGATNEIGFNALPGGYAHDSPASFGNQRSNGFWWTSTEFGEDESYAKVMFYDKSNIEGVHNYNKRMGLSVRCIKD